MTKDYDELVNRLREDSGDYGVMKRGIPMRHELSWDARDQRAWAAAEAIQHLRLILGHVPASVIGEAFIEKEAYKIVE